jgi:ATP-dependent DNA ligase
LSDFEWELQNFTLIEATRSNFNSSCEVFWITSGTQKLTRFMAENFCRASSMGLSEWLSLNPPPYFCETKYDGFRVFIFKSGDKILFATRHGRIYSETSHPQLFKEILPLLSTDVPFQMILDGEYIGPAELHIFDMLQLDQEEVSREPLYKRKEKLEKVLSGDKRRFLVEYSVARSHQEIIDLKARTISQDGEGIIVKNSSSFYGQRNSWLKLKRSDTADCFVIDYERTIEMDRTGIPHSWFIGLYDNGRVIEMGKVGAHLKEVDISRIKIGTVVEIQYQQVTDDYKFRQPLIMRIRDDKLKEECTVSQLPTRPP